MVFFVIGVLFLLMAAGNGLRLDFLLNEEYRGSEAGRSFQRRNVLPYGILGLLFLIWGKLSVSSLDPRVLCIVIVAVALIPVVLLYRNRSRLLREYREEKTK
ncbi:MAG: hypothetical protein MSO56_02565 [Clostridiales bacterium]|nr:hypothetical protein [Clostridiales bacterium]